MVVVIAPGGVSVMVAPPPGSGVSHFAQRTAVAGLLDWQRGHSMRLPVKRLAGCDSH